MKISYPKIKYHDFTGKPKSPGDNLFEPTENIPVGEPVKLPPDMSFEEFAKLGDQKLKF